MGFRVKYFVNAGLLMLFVIYLTGCSESYSSSKTFDDFAGDEFGIDRVSVVKVGRSLPENKEPTLSVLKAQWKYYERDGPYLGWTINANVFDAMTGIVVLYGSETYDNNNSVKIFGVGGDHLNREVAAETNQLRGNGLADKKATVYVIVNYKEGINRNEKHSVSDLTKDFQPEKIIKFDTSIPPIDEYGMVDIANVDDGWCYAETHVIEYGDDKPKCEAVVDKIRRKIIEEKIETFRTECLKCISTDNFGIKEVTVKGYELCDVSCCNILKNSTSRAGIRYLDPSNPGTSKSFDVKNDYDYYLFLAERDNFKNTIQCD